MVLNLIPIGNLCPTHAVNMTPLQADNRRSLWIGFGTAILLMVIAYYLQGSFYPILLAAFALVMIARGMWPALFARHFEERIIEGIPYHRKESPVRWAIFILLCIALAFGGSIISRKYLPAKPNIVAAVVKGVKEAVHAELVASFTSRPVQQDQQGSKPPAPASVPASVPPPIRRSPHNCPGTGNDAYQFCSDDQVGQFAIDEARQIEELATSFSNGPHESFGSRSFFFNQKFNECCLTQLKAVRGEMIQRLGPAGNSPEEEEAWRDLFLFEQIPNSQKQVNFGTPRHTPLNLQNWVLH